MAKVLLIGDGGQPTGFERVCREIGTALTHAGHAVTHRGLGYHPNQAKHKVAPYPYEMKLTSPTFDASDPLAVQQTARWIKEDTPDVVVMVQDLWNQVNYLSYIPREIPTVGYFPTDTPNVKWNFALGAAALTEAVPYTKFGAHETALGLRDAADILAKAYASQGVAPDAKAVWLTLPKDNMELHMRPARLAARQNPSAFTPVSHGIDHTKFVPRDRATARQIFGIPADAFVVLNVNTNQFRKRQDLSIRMFAELLRDVPNAYLVLHCAGDNQRGGWDLPQLARLHGIKERMILVNAGYPHLTDDELVWLYNTADVHINTGGGEGWGLSSVESALCEIPQFVPNWSATREIWAGAAHLLEISDYRMEPKYLNTAHAIVDVRRGAQRLRDHARHPQMREVWGQKARARALQLPNWSSMGEAFVERVARALATHDQVEPMSFEEILAQRDGDLRSELLGFDL